MPTMMVSRPADWPSRVSRSSSQAPNVSSSRTPFMSIETFLALETSLETPSTSVSSSPACGAVHEPKAKSSSRSPFSSLLSRISPMALLLLSCRGADLKEERGGLAARQIDAHAFQRNPLRRDRHTLPRGGVGDEHGAGHPAGDGDADLAAADLARGRAGGIEGALLPGSADAAAAFAQLAPDLDAGTFALAAYGHAELGAAASVIGVALEALPAPFVELDLAASAPGAEQRVEGGAGLGGGCRGDKQRCRGEREGQAQEGANRGCHGVSLSAFCAPGQARIAMTK